MRTLSRDQEELLRELTFLAGGDASLVEEAFDQAPREEGRPPSLIAIAAYILEKTDRHDLAAELRATARGDLPVGSA